MAGVLACSVYLARSSQPLTHTPSVLPGQLESYGTFPPRQDFAVGVMPGLVFSTGLLRSR